MKDILINGRYRVDRKIAAGGFGLVYSGTDLESGDEVAIKLTRNGDEKALLLRNEKEICEALSGGGVGVPRVRWLGDECEYCALVQDALGPSLEDLFNYCGRRFSLKTILLVADQALSRVGYVHSAGFLHRDLKPENLLLGVGGRGNTLHVIDFGLAVDFTDAERYRGAEGVPRWGTREYASIRSENHRHLSWGDDLESLGYMFVYFARGSLPWEGLRGATADEADRSIKEMKESLSGEALCEGVLPREFATYIDYARSLGFGEKPDYLYLRRLFRRLFAAEGFKRDNVFDWTEKRFREIAS